MLPIGVYHLQIKPRSRVQVRLRVDFVPLFLDFESCLYCMSHTHMAQFTFASAAQAKTGGGYVLCTIIEGL